MPGPHRKMVTQEESATVSEGEGEGVAREAGRAERGGRGDGVPVQDRCVPVDAFRLWVDFRSNRRLHVAQDRQG